MSEHADQFEERDDEAEATDDSRYGGDDIVEKQEHKGYGEDEGEREESLPDE
jgi:hypothetical protein